MRIVTIVGARPQIIKAAALSREIQRNFNDKIEEFIVHTGQHYDDNMSEVFFRELSIPAPNVNLNVGSSSHGEQTGRMMEGIEKVLTEYKPDALVIYGDTNSTLAGAVAASKMHIPVFHIEAGLRSFNKKMPEEINRIVADHCSTLMFCPTKTAIQNLENEGFPAGLMSPYSMDKPGVFHAGDIMFDNSVFFAQIAEKQSKIIEDQNLKDIPFILATVHRNDNTDCEDRLRMIFDALCLASINTKLPVVFPLHPRTKKMMDAWNIGSNIPAGADVRIIPPASFLDMILLEKNCRLVLTDSGGVQKEAYFFSRPSIILRPETEWVEIVDLRAAKLADHSAPDIAAQAEAMINYPPTEFPPVFGDGHAAEFICEKMLEFHQSMMRKNAIKK
ncbi:MAG: UDP-N-acetylglucosamine 2-epimerase (non-hydrolyzing) [Bacteroidales bacterium]|jgi:UDP-GlcNAc3NAcA epimerase|nr:UDP-N-acetylglucosamine 2-epimerase (non-hydrolyzing) [Bacteroidales bacterium]HPB01601.1 UDP-N-acetylglucosamine 2-epimerase (non-hydrolyzing) [Bacteroidales bacterium]